MTIKRTRSEVNAVRKILTKLDIKFLECRANRRHQFYMPEFSVDPIPGKQYLTLIFHCAECGTKRNDVYSITIFKDMTFRLVEMTGRSYIHPEGYLFTADMPKITGLEFMQEYLQRIVNLGA